MKEKIAEFIWTILSFGRECSDEWWANQKSSGRPFIDHRRRYLFTLVREEIEKELLTKTELRIEWGKWRNCQTKLHDEGRDDEQTSYESWVIQAQLNKVLKALES